MNQTYFSHTKGVKQWLKILKNLKPKPWLRLTII
jgi:hypothetical protein